MGTKSDIEGTRDDNTMNIEGEGADEAGRMSQRGDDELVRRSQGHGGPRVDPCAKYGHHPKYSKLADGREVERSPRACRHCGVPF